MTVENSGNEVKQPGEGAGTDDPDNSDNYVDVILFGNALDDTVDSPNDVEHGDTKNDLRNPGKTVHKLDEFFHDFSPLVCMLVWWIHITIVSYSFVGCNRNF